MFRGHLKNKIIKPPKYRLRDGRILDHVPINYSLNYFENMLNE